MAIVFFSLSEWINDTYEKNSAITFCTLIIYKLNFMRNLKKNTFENFFVLYIVEKKLLSSCTILTFCKAFDSIPDFENLGYQVEIVNQF